jgi:hypothetical protein
MIPPPTLDEVRGVMIDRRVRSDIVGNVLDGLCGSLERSGESVLELV